MNNNSNGFRSTVLGIMAALGIAAITGIIGWVFTNEVSNGVQLVHIQERQDKVIEQIKDHEQRLRFIEEQLGKWPRKSSHSDGSYQ
jgi:hypothetical protein